MKRVWYRIIRFVKDRQVSYAFLIALLLSVFGYFSNNWVIFSSEELNLYTSIESLRKIFESDDAEYRGALFVNTSMDNALVDVYDSSGGYVIGNTKITDRRKLLEFLKLLEGTDYAYLVIDINFPQELTHKDSVGKQLDNKLIEQIKRMERCVVATHRDIVLMGNLEHKAALADYKSTVTATNFTRYKYFEEIPSIPLHVYNEIRKSQGADTVACCFASSYLGFYWEGNKLCQNSVFLKFSSKGFPQLSKIRTEIGNLINVEQYNYRNLGSDFIDHLDYGLPREEIQEDLKSYLKDAGNGKRPIVFIGNLQEDLHDTYAGLQPGVIILYNAIKALFEGRHLVNPLRFICIFLVYFIISLFILKDRELLYFIPDKFRRRYPFIHILLQFITISTVLLIIDIIDISIFNVTSNFFLTILFFGIIKLYISFKKVKNEEAC